MIVAKQPLKLSELSNALAIRIGAEDHSDRRVPRPALIQDLCGHFVTLDLENRGSSSDPILKLTHKSIQEFFLEDPASLGVPEQHRKFFVDPSLGHLEVGRACLVYLNYARYQDPVDVSAILDGDTTKGHEFLRYAATFWFRHLMETDHSTELLACVEQFVRSPAFWTCLMVQSKIAPHLFATYTEAKRGSYRMGIAGPRDSVANDRISFASPIPLWLDEFEPTGSSIAFGIHSFVKQWHPVLTTHPSAVSQCKSEVNGRPEYPCNHSSRGDRVAVFHLLSGENSIRSKIQQLQSVCVEKDRLCAVILENQEKDVILEEICISREGSASRNLISMPAPQPSELTSVLHAFRVTDTTEPSLWLLDLQGLNSIKCLGSEQKLYDVPRHIKKIIAGAKEHSANETWFIADKNSGCNANGEIFAYHFSKFHSNSTEDDDSGYQSMKSGSDSDSGSESDALDAKEPQSSHCLIMICRGSPPIWFAWHAAVQTRLQVSSAFHPKEPIAIWTHAAHEVCMANLHTGHITNGILPEPVNVQLRFATAVRKGETLRPHALDECNANVMRQNFTFHLVENSYTTSCVPFLKTPLDLPAQSRCRPSNSPRTMTGLNHCGEPSLSSTSHIDSASPPIPYLHLWSSPLGPRNSYL